MDWPTNADGPGRRRDGGGGEEEGDEGDMADDVFVLGKRSAWVKRSS